VDEHQLRKQLKDFRIHSRLGKIDEETFLVIKEYLDAEILTIQKELDRVVPQISNLEKLLAKSMKKLENLSTVWTSSGYEEKRMLQKTLFPKKVLFHAEKHE